MSPDFPRSFPTLTYYYLQLLSFCNHNIPSLPPFFPYLEYMHILLINFPLALISLTSFKNSVSFRPDTPTVLYLQCRHPRSHYSIILHLNLISSTLSNYISSLPLTRVSFTAKISILSLPCSYLLGLIHPFPKLARYPSPIQWNTGKQVHF